MIPVLVFAEGSSIVSFDDRIKRSNGGGEWDGGWRVGGWDANTMNSYD